MGLIQQTNICNHKHISQGMPTTGMLLTENNLFPWQKVEITHRLQGLSMSLLNPTKLNFNLK